MNTIAAMTIALLSLTCGLIGAEPADASPHNEGQAAADRVIDANLADAMKAYQAYKAVLAKAQEKTIKDLEKLKVDFTKKGEFPVAEFVVTLMKDVKHGLLGQRILAKDEMADLFGNGMQMAKILAGKTFAFSNANGFLTTLTLDPGGHLIGSQHVNETTWRTDEDKHLLLFIRNDGVTSSIFSKFTIVDNKLEIEGEYQFGDMKHYLKESP